MKKYCAQCFKPLTKWEWQGLTMPDHPWFCKNPPCPCYNLLQIGEDIEYVKALKQHKKEQKHLEANL